MKPNTWLDENTLIPRRLYTWLDVEMLVKKKKLNQEWPDQVQNITVYSDGIEVLLSKKEAHDDIKEIFAKWFLDWYDREKNCVYLAGEQGEQNILPVIYETGDYMFNDIKTELKPLFSEIVFLNDDVVLSKLNFPAAVTNTIKIFSFYSFKGGVGRTLHMVAAVKALLEKINSRSIKVLIVDADLEAPGLTWWAQKSGETTELSYLDFLALAHYDSSENYAHTLKVTVNALKQVPMTFGKYSCYFLPAFRDEDQLMRFPLRPENMVRGPEQSWITGNLLFYLGKALEVDYIFVDLRAGLSELSAPLLFDPRIVRTVVTTFSRQSVEGTELALRQMAKLAPPLEMVNEGMYFDPTIVFSMVPEELSQSNEFSEVEERLISIYPDREQFDEVSPPRIATWTSFFANELLFLDNLSGTLKKLNGKSLLKIMDEMINGLLNFSSKKELQHFDKTKIKSKLKDLEIICEKLEYAESATRVGFLSTKPIVELGLRFSQNIPLSVVIGPKGSGKTYLFMQFMHLKTWAEFLESIDIYRTGSVSNKEAVLNKETLLFPLLEPLRLGNEASKLIAEVRENVKRRLNKSEGLFNSTDLRDAVRSALSAKTNWHETDWRRYWISLFGKMIGLVESPGQDWIDIKQIQAVLKASNIKLVMVIDGLEDLFQDIKNSPEQQMALRGLLELPLVLRDYRENMLGIICFVRGDIVRSSIKQNYGQFENLYRSFSLTWNMEDSLRLVFWICIQAGMAKDNVENLMQTDANEMSEKLISIWGRKLGPENSKESYTTNWVLAVLSDYNGQLQARHMVRFIKYAAGESKKHINFTDRFLQPAGIRSAIAPCSTKKIEEYEQEFDNLKGIFDELRSIDSSLKKIPFNPEDLHINKSDIDVLETAGVIQEMDGRFYMHEIFRQGLGFSLEKGARPKVLAMKRKYLPY